MCFARPLTLVLLLSALARADTLNLSGRGAGQVEEIKRRIGPAQLRTKANGWHYIRGRILRILPADPTAPVGDARREGLFHFHPWKVGDGEAPRPVLLPRAWFTPGIDEFDTLQDLRDAFGDVDKALRVPIGSAAWRAGVLRMIDPGGAMGYSDGEAAPEGVKPGWYVRYLRNGTSPADQQLVMRRPWHAVRTTVYQHHVMLGLIDAAIRAAVHDQYEAGMASAAAGAVVLICSLYRVDPEMVDEAQRPIASRCKESGVALYIQLSSRIDPLTELHIRKDAAEREMPVTDPELPTTPDQVVVGALDIASAPMFRGLYLRAADGSDDGCVILESLRRLHAGVRDENFGTYTPPALTKAKARAVMLALLRVPANWTESEDPEVRASFVRRRELQRRVAGMEFGDNEQENASTRLIFSLMNEIGWGTPEEMADRVDRLVRDTRHHPGEGESELEMTGLRMKALVVMRRGARSELSAHRGLARHVERKIRKIQDDARDEGDSRGDEDAKVWLRRLAEAEAGDTDD